MRKSFIQYLILSILLVSCSPKIEFKIIAWEGYTPPQALKEFKKIIEDKYGVELSFKVTIPQNEEEMYKQLVAGDVHVMAISHYLFNAKEYFNFSNDILLPLKMEKIPRYQYLFNPIKELKFENINGLPYGTPVAHSAYRLIYDQNKINTPPSSWKVLFDSSNDGAYSVSDYNWEMNSYVTNLVLGVPSSNFNNHKIYQEKRFIKKIKELAKGSDRYLGSVERPAELEGKTYAAVFGNFLSENNTKLEKWKFASPKEGEPAYLDYFVISRSLANQPLLVDISHEWLNYTLSKSYQLKVVVEHLGEMPVTENIKTALSHYQIQRFNLDNPDHIKERRIFWNPRSLETLKVQKDAWRQATSNTND